MTGHKKYIQFSGNMVVSPLKWGFESSFFVILGEIYVKISTNIAFG